MVFSQRPRLSGSRKVSLSEERALDAVLDQVVGVGGIAGQGGRIAPQTGHVREQRTDQSVGCWPATTLASPRIV